jgi:polysaccharide biosynthesis transport protein
MESARVTVRDYFRALNRRRWLVVLAMCATVGSAVALTLLQDPIYESTAEIIVEPRPSNTVFEQEAEPFTQNLDRAVQTEIRVIEGTRVRENVRDRLGLPTVGPRVQARAVGATNVITLTLQSGDPATAQILLEAHIDAYVDARRQQARASIDAASAEVDVQVAALQEQIDDIDRWLDWAPGSSLAYRREALIQQQASFRLRLGELRVDAALTTGGVSYVRGADLPEEAIDPQPRDTVILAVIGGLILGIGAALIVDYLDESVVTVDDVAAIDGPPVLAAVPAQRHMDAAPIATESAAGAALESFRGLQTNIAFLGLDRPMRVIQVTSSLPGEGKSTTASNLAAVLAGAGHRVVLVDADLRKPRLHTSFAIGQFPGLTEVLLGVAPHEVLRTVGPNLSLMTAGAAPTNPGSLVLGSQVAEVLRSLADEFDYVIVDSPPVLPVADAVGFARGVDGVLVVAQSQRVGRRALAQTLTRLGQAGVTPIGVVLNRTPKGDDGYYGYGYGYSYGDAAPATAAPRALRGDGVAGGDDIGAKRRARGMG